MSSFISSVFFSCSIHYKITSWSLAAFYTIIRWPFLSPREAIALLLLQPLEVKEEADPFCLVGGPWLPVSGCHEMWPSDWEHKYAKSLQVCIYVWTFAASVFGGSRKKNIGHLGWRQCNICLYKAPGSSFFLALNGKVNETHLYTWNRCYKGWY